MKYVLGCGFVRKYLLKRMKLKRHFKVCFLRIESCNINNVPRITKLTQILFMISSKQKKHDELTLRNHHQCSISSASLPEVHYNVKGNEKGDGPKTPQKKFGIFKKGKRNGKNMKNEAKGQGKSKGKSFTCHKCGGPNYFARKY
jgi:hypothetical protein